MNELTPKYEIEENRGQTTFYIFLQPEKIFLLKFNLI